MAWRFKNRICGRGGILAGVVLASAVIWACWWFLWPLRESGRWARTFDAVAVGTPVERVQSVFTALSPRHQSRWEVTSPRNRASPVPTNAVSVLYYNGPHHWHYQFFVDEQQRIVGKLKHWD